LYAEAFDSVGAIDKLESFTSIFGQRFYNLPIHTEKIKLVRQKWTVPESYSFGKNNTVRPLRAGEEILWTII
jgi:dihydroorotase